MVLTKDEALKDVQFNAEGFMLDPKAWTPELAEAMAEGEGIQLTERHWLVINFARHEYEANGEAPTLRAITKNSGVDTREMYALFPAGPAKLAAKLAGLGKPTGCI
ncbi:MAG TPA: TusE/DsrC/DsvC family sulfur relay protein [Anaerolineales bacterium]